MIKISNFNNLFKVIIKSAQKVRTAVKTGTPVNMSTLDKVVGKVATIGMIVKQVVSKSTPIATEISAADLEYMINDALMDIVPQQFEGVMIGLRVKYTLDAQLYGLAQALRDYIDIDVSDIIEVGMTADDVESAIYDAVEEQISNISDMEGICKNFWNGKDLEEFM